MMKRLKNKKSTLLCVLSVLLFLFSSCEDTEDFDNKAFISSAKVNTIIVKGTNETDEAVIQTEIAKQEEIDITITYQMDPSLVNTYNMTYEEEAIIVPAENFEIPNLVSTIPAGAIKGNDIEVHFKDLSTLDRDLVYVLPITVAEANIDLLNSARTVYFVIKGGALINTVANITENFLELKDPMTSTLKNIKQLTVEALIKVDKFDKLISTIMGIENVFLIRIGDAGVPDNQIQLATSSGNVTDPSWQVPTNEWTHLALTYDTSNGAVEVYLNGIKKGDTKKINYSMPIDWASSMFFVGRSYDANRWLEADVCEYRIWNRVLTAEEINSKNHFYEVESNSEGLVAYWKFDEGNGQVITDHTGNGNTIVAAEDLTWKPVTLPK